MGVSTGSSRHLSADRLRAARAGNQARPGLYASRSAAGLTGSPVRSPGVERLRELAGEGRLAEAAAVAGAVDRPALTAAAYEIAWPIVFARLTRRFEQGRGHTVCALGVDRLADECLDRFHDDVEAVVDDLLAHARQPVRDLEAWIAGRLTAATVNAHRRSRGRRGALQRPRLPGWLADALGHDRWLTDLAVEILVWVGVRTAAGAGLWPLDSWAHQRATVTGDWQHSDSSQAGRDVETVLAAMRRRPDWYDAYVERPLGGKQAPVWTGEPARDLPLTDPHHHVDAELLRLAADAVRAIDGRLAGGEAAEGVVVDVIRAVFGRSVTIAGLENSPYATADPIGGLSGALTDTATIERIVATVRDITRDRVQPRQPI
jgi:hypothetical protein